MTLVKICGIMREEELDMAAQADYIGLVVGTGTRRSLDPLAARRLLERSSVRSVMVTTAPAEEALRTARIVEPDVVQCYRLDPAAVGELRRHGFKVWAGMPVGVPGDAENILEMSASAQAIVLDTPSPQGGGSGASHDWKRSAAIRRMLSVPAILAGGLSPENVASAIQAVRPDGVDVSSGVETDGRKDAARIARFIEEARRC